jgi:hypothetical protein
MIPQILLLLRLRRGHTRSGLAAVDLLAALLTYLKAAPSISSLIPAARIYDEVAPAGVAPPYLLALAYTEPKPGRTADDQTVTVRLGVITSTGLDAARAAGIAVKNAVDTRAVNPTALGRARFSWTGGRERACLRGNSAPRKMPGLGKGGTYVYAETIEYTFHVTPSQ